MEPSTGGTAVGTSPELLAASRARLRRYVRLLGCSDADADDLVQEACLRWLAPGFEERNVVATDAWLRTTVRRLWIDAVRRRRLEPEVGHDPEVWAEGVDACIARGDLTVDPSHADARQDALAECRKALRGRAARVVELTYDERLARHEVASRMSMTPNGVKTLLQRTRAQLRACVQRTLRRS